MLTKTMVAMMDDQADTRQRSSQQKQSMRSLSIPLIISTVLLLTESTLPILALTPPTSTSRRRLPSPSSVCRYYAIDHRRCKISIPISQNSYGLLDWSCAYASRSNDQATFGPEQHQTPVLSVALSIQSLLEAGRLDDAIQELKECNNNDTEIPSSTYHSLIEACCAGGFESKNHNNNKRQPKKYNIKINNKRDDVDRIEVASELLGLMRERKQITEHAFEIIIAGYSRRGQWEEAYRKLSEMEEMYLGASNNENATHKSGNSISLNIYQTVLTSMANSDQYQHVNKLLTKMRRQGIRPTVYTYNALLKICAADNIPRWKEGLSILSQCQREPGVTPDLISYTTAMKVCARGHQADKAMELFRAVKDMKELELDVYFYTTAMDACAKGGKWRKALYLLDEMKEERGILPNVVTYGVAIAACGNGGQWQKALELLESMRDNNLSINTITYNSAIAALSKAARSESKTKQSGVSDTKDVDVLWQKALHLIQCMETEGVKRDSFTYSSAISTCGAAGRWKEALNLIQSMKREGGVRPNRVAYTSAITACANARYASVAMYPS
jgi:pentatricopeptide repeat protein